MARHDQVPDPRDTQCFNCKQGACEVCVDAIRKKYTKDRICTCIRPEHKQKVDDA